MCRLNRHTSYPTAKLEKKFRTAMKNRATLPVAAISALRREANPAPGPSAVRKPGEIENCIRLIVYPQD